MQCVNTCMFKGEFIIIPHVLFLINIGCVLRTALTLYMEDEALPLPTLEEVLLCDSTTTVEQVSLLNMC